MFRGDRPYWWVGETPLYNGETRPFLRQFPNTCESGPGTPSGHLMMNVALFYVAARGITTFFVWNSSYFRQVKLWSGKSYTMKCNYFPKSFQSYFLTKCNSVKLYMILQEMYFIDFIIFIIKVKLFSFMHYIAVKLRSGSLHS